MHRAFRQVEQRTDVLNCVSLKVVEHDDEPRGLRQGMDRLLYVQLRLILLAARHLLVQRKIRLFAQIVFAFVLNCYQYSENPGVIPVKIFTKIPEDS